MTHNLLTASALLVAVSSAATAQTMTMSFDQAAYVTCREAQAMPLEQRKALAVGLAEHSARQRGVVFPDDEPGAQIAYLVRGGCTLSPDAYLFTVIDRAVIAEQSKLTKRR